MFSSLFDSVFFYIAFICLYSSLHFWRHDKYIDKHVYLLNYIITHYEQFIKKVSHL